jgi:hypothetical protein
LSPNPSGKNQVTGGLADSSRNRVFHSLLMTIRPSFFRCSTRKLSVVLLGALLAPALPAQIAITTVSTTLSDVGNSNTNGVRFENTTIAVSSFLDLYGNIYTANTVAGAAYVRRNTTAGNANNTSVWYADSLTDADRYRAPYASTDPSLLLGNNILRGSDNTFANGTGAAEVGNIERLDFVFSGGLTANLSTAFSVFDRGAAGVHDSVKIAVITGWDSVNNVPTAYGGILVGINSANYGVTNPIGTFNYDIFRYSNGDNLGASDYWDSSAAGEAQGIGGSIISMSDLGIAAGTTIYGYSLMGYDVTNGGSMANLVNWNNTTYYRSDTTGATGTGGIDLSAVNGVLYNRAVPEPSTYGAILMGAALAGWFWRKRKLNAAIAA